MMRLALDGTPLLGPRSGVGEGVSGTILELSRRPDLEVVAHGLTLRGRKDLAAAAAPAVAPPTASPRGGPPGGPPRQPHLPGAPRASVVAACGVPARRALDRPHR